MARIRITSGQGYLGQAANARRRAEEAEKERKFRGEQASKERWETFGLNALGGAIQTGLGWAGEYMPHKAEPREDARAESEARVARADQVRQQGKLDLREAGRAKQSAEHARMVQEERRRLEYGTAESPLTAPVGQTPSTPPPTVTGAVPPTVTGAVPAVPPKSLKPAERKVTWGGAQEEVTPPVPSQFGATGGASVMPEGAMQPMKRPLTVPQPQRRPAVTAPTPREQPTPTPPEPTPASQGQEVSTPEDVNRVVGELRAAGPPGRPTRESAPGETVYEREARAGIEADRLKADTALYMRTLDVAERIAEQSVAERPKRGRLGRQLPRVTLIAPRSMADVGQRGVQAFLRSNQGADTGAVPGTGRSSRANPVDSVMAMVSDWPADKRARLRNIIDNLASHKAGLDAAPPGVVATQLQTYDLDGLNALVEGSTEDQNAAMDRLVNQTSRARRTELFDRSEDRLENTKLRNSATALRQANRQQFDAQMAAAKRASDSALQEWKVNQTHANSIVAMDAQARYAIYVSASRPYTLQGLTSSTRITPDPRDSPAVEPRTVDPPPEYTAPEPVGMTEGDAAASQSQPLPTEEQAGAKLRNAGIEDNTANRRRFINLIDSQFTEGTDATRLRQAIDEMRRPVSE